VCGSVGGSLQTAVFVNGGDITNPGLTTASDEVAVGQLRLNGWAYASNFQIAELTTWSLALT
jgi:hypothetical protein